jgi:uncharacterized protein (DUF2062 family)
MKLFDKWKPILVGVLISALVLSVTAQVFNLFFVLTFFSLKTFMLKYED